MIKLIISDLDGTLLQNGDQKLSCDMLKLIPKMHELGIQFAAASGRQYQNMKRLFGPVWKDIIFIGENGAIIVNQDEIWDKTVIPQHRARSLIRDLYQNEQCDVMVSGVSSVYMQPKPSSHPYVNFILYELKNTITIVDDIASLDEDIIKISAIAYDNNSMQLGNVLKSKWSDHFNVAIAGKEWVDFTITNKGEAIRKLQNRLSLSGGEMAAFGDNYNDESMFEAVGYSYAMHSAGDEIRKMARHCCGTVEDVIKNIMLYQQSI